MFKRNIKLFMLLLLSAMILIYVLLDLVLEIQGERYYLKKQNLLQYDKNGDKKASSLIICKNSIVVIF